MLIILLSTCIYEITVNLVSCSQGPVFINPDVLLSSQTVPPTNQGNYVTQTVYGFLDFTTTIGNTVMVFSPQSAAPGKLETIRCNLFIVYQSNN